MLSFDRRGAGEPLVLLHGIGHRWQAWEPVIDRLAEHHDVIAIDLPGFGQSPPPASGIPDGMPAAVAAASEVLADLGLVRRVPLITENEVQGSPPHIGLPHVAGNSLGGAIALELAAAGLAASVTALSPAGFGTPAQMRYALGVLHMLRLGAMLPTPVIRRAYELGAVRAAAFGMLMRRPGWMGVEAAYGDTLALRSAPAFRPVARAGLRYAFAGAPTCPVTIAWGTRDRILSPRMARLARERLPDARHVELPGCGHIPMGDDPDLVASVILATTGGAGGHRRVGDHQPG